MSKPKLRKHWVPGAHSHGAAEVSPEWRHAIVEHVTEHVGAPTNVLHEEKSKFVHVDVHIVPPRRGQPFWFLFTTGMSARAMATPVCEHGCEHGSRFAEVSVLLPPWWQVSLATWTREPSWFWPVRELKNVAVHPHRGATWMGVGHTLSSHPATPFDPSTRLCASLLLPPVSTSADVCTIQAGSERIELMTLWPIHADELALARAGGLASLCDAFDAVGVSDVIDPTRRSALSREERAQLLS